MLKKKQYEVTKPCWLDGHLQPVGAKLFLFERQAKYLPHALKEVLPAPAPAEAVEPVADAAPVEVEAAPEADAAEPKADRSRRKG